MRDKRGRGQAGEGAETTAPAAPAAAQAPKPDEETARIQELARLLQGFTGELRKLEESLRTLSAHVERMRTASAGDRPKTLH